MKTLASKDLAIVRWSGSYNMEVGDQISDKLWTRYVNNYKKAYPDTTVASEKKRESFLPEDAAERKKFPMYRGLLNYFPKACALLSRVSYEGSQQHHPDEEMHWDRTKSQDHPDCVIRHFTEGMENNDVWLVTQATWRCMAQVELMLESLVEEGVSIEDVVPKP